MFNKQIIGFLKELELNNNKAWFDQNRDKYKVLRNEFKQEVEEILFKVAGIDANFRITPENFKNYIKIFRINRDIRFSKDKRPYKSNFAAVYGFGKMEDGNPMYYLHIQPGNCFLAGGIYMPDSSYLRKIRDKIVKKHKDLRNVLEDKEFMNMFPVGLDKSPKLKTCPRGYDKDHEAIDLLRLKSFTVSRNFSEKEFFGKNFEKLMVETFTEIKKLNDFLRV